MFCQTYEINTISSPSSQSMTTTANFFTATSKNLCHVKAIDFQLFFCGSWTSNYFYEPIILITRF